MRPCLAACLLVWCSCEPQQEAIGETECVANLSPSLDGVIGPAGHVALTGGTSLILLGADGELEWSVDCIVRCGEASIDQDGNVYLAGSEGDDLELVKRSAEDGAVEWSHSFASSSATTLTVAADGTAWLLLNGDEPIDFGGGPVSGPRGTGRWARFSPDGAHIASGALDFHVAFLRATALAGGGLLVIDEESQSLVEIDDTGAELWRVDRRIYDFAVHEDGELTVAEFIEVDEAAGESRTRLVRLDADRNERWRRSVASDVIITPLASGGVMVSGNDGLAFQGDVSFLEHFDADGASTREVFLDYVLLFAGAPFDGYRFVDLNSGEIDLHDRTARSDHGGLIVGRADPRP